MKWLIRIGMPCLALAGCIWGDISLARWLFGHLPDLGEWLFWAKLGIGFGIFWVTAGIITLITVAAGVIAAAITED